jgi:alpha-L-fucosidase
VPYPCWATFPYVSTGAGESAGQDISRNGFALLKRGDPNGTFWMPAMSDAPLRGHGGHEWFWEPGDERLIYPLDRLVDMYHGSVGNNSTLILGITPDTRGLIPEADVKRLQEFGQAIRRTFSDPIAKTAANGYRIQLSLDPNTEFDTVVIQEDIQQGERVRQYCLEIRQEGTWSTLAEGTCIGHKRIHRLPLLRADGMRLVLQRATATPIIKNLAVYNSVRSEKPPGSLVQLCCGSSLK